jgi:hypothetical protein
MNTIMRGNAAEGSVLAALVHADIPVYMPFGDGSPFDLAAVMPADGSVVRIQVKSGRIKNGCVYFNARSTDHGHGRRRYDGRADVFAVHVRALHRLFVIPVDECRTYSGILRLEPCRNNQRVGVRFAHDYTFERWVEEAWRKYWELAAAAAPAKAA